MYEQVVEILQLCPCPLALLACLVMLFLYNNKLNNLDKRLTKIEKNIIDIYKLLISTAPAYKRPKN